MFKPILLTIATAAVLVACKPKTDTAAPNAPATAAASADGQAAKANTVAIHTARGVMNVPDNPSKIAVFDLASLDTLEALGVSVAGSPKKVLVPYLKPVIENTNDIGTLFEPNYEALNALQPQLIIISGRTAPKYNDLTKIAPTVDMSDSGQDLIGDGLKLIDTYGTLFHKQAEAQRLHSEVQDLFAATKTAVKGKGNGLMVMVNAGKLSVFGADSRFGWIHKDLGVPVADSNIKVAKHGQPVSFEYIQKLDPDWLFVLDRSAAIGEEGKAAKAVLDNDLMHQTKAWKKGHIVYLSGASYVAAGGVQQIKTDLNNIKAAFAK